MNSNNQTYDKLVKVSDEGKIRIKKMLAVMGYAVFFSIWLIFALNNPNILVPAIIAGILCTLILMFITWKYFNVEYEYSIWYGSFELAKIYAKKKERCSLFAKFCKNSVSFFNIINIITPLQLTSYLQQEQ